ncbi:unnamed protein product [Nesidiocoris tenuis]|uniref:Uncharacterized protein n=1 Tax=Nesidiocoris tenuis TaxID=355587 RepID=A0A6H5HFM8_9HEMI|nr:unnamed protein product [Nesidiocoris tenuis]
MSNVPGKEKDAGKAHGHEENIKSSHHRVDKLNVDLRESVFGEEEVRSNSPRGAILSLTMDSRKKAELYFWGRSEAGINGERFGSAAKGVAK